MKILARELIATVFHQRSLVERSNRKCLRRPLTTTRSGDGSATAVVIRRESKERKRKAGRVCCELITRDFHAKTSSRRSRGLSSSKDSKRTTWRFSTKTKQRVASRN